MNVLSLFDGIACGRVALERASIIIDNYYASEIDSKAILVAMSNYPDIKQIGDISKVRAIDLPRIELLMGGSPCQGFSFGGKHLGFEDPRSALFFEYVRLLKECNPIWFLLENVPMNKYSQGVISHALNVSPIMINSSLVSAQNRKRLYWTNIPVLNLPEDKGIYFPSIREQPNLPIWTDGKEIKIRAWKAQQKPFDKVLEENKRTKVPCLTARGFNQYHSGMVIVKESNGYRYLSVLEGERCQTLPDGYTKSVKDSIASRLLGNGWTVDVIAHILSFIKFRSKSGE